MDEFYPPLPSEQYCQHCRLRQLACYCAHQPNIITPIQFVLVYHPKELSRLNNTGQLISRGIAHTQKIVWQRKQSLDLESSIKTLLVYPTHLACRYRGEEGSVHPVEATHQLHKAMVPTPVAKQYTLRLVLIDATWQEAQKMYCQSPELQRLHLFDTTVVQDLDESLYELRKNQRSGGVSTVETAEACLRALGDDAGADALKQYFLKFLLHSKASASNHAVIEPHKTVV